MGQCYDVTYDLKVKDRDGLIESMNKYIDETNGVRVNWSLERGDRDTLLGLMKILITDNYFDCEGDCYSSAFDASYGWECVMLEMFEQMAPYLKNGSYCEVWPDSGRDYGVVKNGKVKWRGNYEDDIK